MNYLKLFIILCLFSGGLAMADYPTSDHFDGVLFHNDKPIAKRGFLDFFRWVREGGRKKWPDHVDNKAIPQLASTSDPNTIHVTSVNHASSLIQINGMNILTDPIFSERASPFSWIGPKRVRPPGIELDKLPKIHYVIVSHNHYDHLDLPSLRALDKQFHPQFIVPLGNKNLLNGEGIANVTELDWWQYFSLGERGSIQLVPCQHWSARGLFDRFKTLWGAYVIAADSWKVFFIGDAGYSPIFKTIYERVGAMDVSIIPIGAYEPRWFMKDFHMNPEEAVQTHLDLHSRQSVGSHFGTFQLTNEGIGEPPQALAESLKKHSLAKEMFLAPEPGQTFVFHKN